MFGTEAGDATPAGALDVLIVDDNPMLVASVRELFELSGCACATAYDGQAALDLLETLSEPPHAILCDLVMPRMDGFELLQVLRRDERWRGVFVVIVSGRDEDRAPALSFGADAFLPKPYPIPRLIELVVGRRPSGE
jgi:chemosensory pili system protein ChpA (sensor histidine kinase/response regulator)